MTTVDYRKPVRFAAAAYQAGLAGKWNTAARVLQRISDECGGEGLCVALMAWCDAYVDHATDGKPVRSEARMNFIQTSTGQLDDETSTRLPERVRWAGQLIAARAGMDGTRLRELLDAIPDDPHEHGQYVFMVLRLIATTVNGLPRGFAVMGSAT